ncbi:hypothetical protein [Streptomyces soliscabiei]|uniref:hypothetical protein n=1 Tax=Streptomyces soliscabiei TaxID=588897 RepID=UPI0029A44FA0|nr:hypothetical protein [Streptomyces sp. NY05-11A]MDX2678122.1 hypothetical protein [Streptomyces sp. NY05-11A]
MPTPTQPNSAPVGLAGVVGPEVVELYRFHGKDHRELGIGLADHCGLHSASVQGHATSSRTGDEIRLRSAPCHTAGHPTDWGKERGGSMRVIPRPAVPAGPLRDLKDLLYESYLAAGPPTLDEMTVAMSEVDADDDTVKSAPSRDTIQRIIRLPVLPAG